MESQKSRMPSHCHDTREQGPEPTGGVVRRLLHRVQGATPEDPKGTGPHGLAPAGHRSGTGAASAEKYLQEERNSRPAPLE